MFNDLQKLNLFPISTSDIIVKMAIAFFCGLVIAWLYRRTYRGPGYSQSFITSIVLLSMITAVVIMVIGNSLARAFGLVGAMSIIRFRTALKERLDIIYVFFSLAVGMATGAGYYKIAITGTIFVGFVLFVFSKTNFASPKKKEYLLQFYYTPNGKETPNYQAVLDEHRRKCHIINAKTLDEHELLELSYSVQLKDKDNNDRFLRDLRKTGGVQNINLFFDEEEF